MALQNDAAGAGRDDLGVRYDAPRAQRWQIRPQVLERFRESEDTEWLTTGASVEKVLERVKITHEDAQAIVDAISESGASSLACRARIAFGWRAMLAA